MKLLPFLRHNFIIAKYIRHDNDKLFHVQIILITIAIIYLKMSLLKSFAIYQKSKHVHKEIDRIKSLFELVIKVINQCVVLLKSTFSVLFNYSELHNSAKLRTYKIKVIYQCVVLLTVQFVIC